MKNISYTLLVFSWFMSFSLAADKVDLQKLFNEKNISAIEKILIQEPQNGEAYYLASLYYAVGDDEIGTNKDEVKRLQYLGKSAELGWGDAEVQYGFHLLNAGESEQGIAYIKKSAEQGNINALAVMGDLYFAGYQDNEGNEVIQPDLDKAIELLEQAVAQDSQDARYTLGHIYLDEALGKQNIAKALELFEANIDYENKIGHLPTIISLINLHNEGLQVEPDVAKLLDYYYLANLQNYAPSFYTVGIVQQEGRKGSKLEVSKDLEASFINLNKAAAVGVIDAMFKVGEMYFKGEGVEQSDTNAYIWLSVAEDLTGNKTNYSETILELIPKRQRQSAVDDKNQLKRFFGLPNEQKEKDLKDEK